MQIISDRKGIKVDGLSLKIEAFPNILNKSWDGKVA